MTEYLCLPEVIATHFFELIDVKQKGYISTDQFADSMAAIFVAPLEDRIKLTFQILDFNNDGKLSAEDVHRLLSFVDLEGMAKEAGNEASEGKYTKIQTFHSRSQHQREIKIFINQVFENKEFLTLEDYIKINKQVSSEMFCSVMSCLHYYLPCTTTIL